MSNVIAEGKDRELPPDPHGEILRGPTSASAELKYEVAEASAHKDAGRTDAMRERSSIESRTDLRLAATNEAMRADPSRSSATLVVERETARNWAELDAADFGRIRSDSRREAALEAIAGHVRVSPEYADELKKRSPVLAESAKTINDERYQMERQIALPLLERNAAALVARGGAESLPASEQRELAQQDAKSLAMVPAGGERQLAAAVIGENARNHTAYREELQKVAPQLAREAYEAVADRESLRAIERRNVDLMPVPRDTLAVADARAFVKEDVASIETIKDKGTRHDAAVTIGDNMRDQRNYRAELHLRAPQVANEVQVATAEQDRRIVEKEDRKAADFAAMQLAMAERASAWTPEQAAEQARKDVAALRTVDGAERQYATADMAIAAEKSKAYSDTLAKEAPDVAREVEARREREAAERAQAEQRRDSLNAAALTRASLIDAAALAAVANIRSRETARVVNQLANTPETTTPQLRDAQQAHRAPASDRPMLAATDPDLAAQQGRAIKRPVGEQELSDALLTRYIVSQEKKGILDKGATAFTLRHGDEQGRVAFVDVGKSLSTEREDKATIRAMVEVASAKNWKEITVSGTDDFRRNAWVEASLNGIKVRGYEPREADKVLLAEMQDRHKPSNVITVGDHEQRREDPQPASAAVVEQTPQRKHIDGDALTLHEKTVLDHSRGILNAKALGDQFTDSALRELESKLRGERVYVGEIVDHGKAPYKFDKENDESYYVTLKTRAGEQVIWGKGLAEAMQERSSGEQVVLQNIGKRDVTVQERVRDAQGQVVATRPKESQLNAWKADLLARYSERAKTDFADRSSPRRPALGVYDPKAPRDSAQRGGPARAPETDRANEQQRSPRER